MKPTQHKRRVPQRPVRRDERTEAHLHELVWTAANGARGAEEAISEARGIMKLVMAHLDGERESEDAIRVMIAMWFERHGEPR